MTPGIKLAGALLAVAGSAAVAGAVVMNARLGGLGYFVVGVPVAVLAGVFGVVGWWLVWRFSTGSPRVSLVSGLVLWVLGVAVLGVLGWVGLNSRPSIP